MSRSVPELIRYLKSSVDAQGLVTDADLHRRMVANHDMMTPECRGTLAFGEPAKPSRIDEVNAFCLATFGHSLPDDYRTFLGLCDGLYAGFLEPGDPVVPGTDYFDDHALVSCDVLWSTIATPYREETLPDGSRHRRFLPFVPVFELVDVGFHGFDLSQGTNAGLFFIDREMMFDEDPEFDHLAPSFAAWLAKFVDHGLSIAPFW